MLAPLEQKATVFQWTGLSDDCRASYSFACIATGLRGVIIGSFMDDNRLSNDVLFFIVTVQTPLVGTKVEGGTPFGIGDKIAYVSLVVSIFVTPLAMWLLGGVPMSARGFPVMGRAVGIFVKVNGMGPCVKPLSTTFISTLPSASVNHTRPLTSLSLVPFSKRAMSACPVLLSVSFASLLSRSFSLFMDSLVLSLFRLTSLQEAIDNRKVEIRINFAYFIRSKFLALYLKLTGMGRLGKGLCRRGHHLFLLG